MLPWALRLNTKASGLSDVPARRVFRIVLGVSETEARHLASVLRGTVYKSRGGQSRGYRLLDAAPEELTPERARVSIARHFLSLPAGQRKIQVQGALPSDPDAVSVLVGKIGASREVTTKALQMMQNQGILGLKHDADGWVYLIRWR